MRFPWRALLIGVLFSIVFSYVSIVGGNRQALYLPATQISSISILLCLLLVVALNPLLRAIRAGVFSRQEIFLVFIMTTVPAGIPVFGFICEAIPLAGGLHHPEWNTPQRGWNDTLVPLLDEDYFIGAPLFGTRDVEDWDAFSRGLLEAEGRQTPDPNVRLRTLLPDAAESIVRKAARGPVLRPEEAAAAEAAAEGDVLTAREETLLAEALAREGLLPDEKAVLEKAAKLAEETKNGRADDEKQGLEEEEKGVLATAVHGLTLRDKAEFASAMRSLLRRPDFYAPKAFAGVELPEEARDLLSRPRDSLVAEEVERLNRYLIEAGWPQTIRHSKFLDDQKAVLGYVRGLRALDREAYPPFIMKNEESLGDFFGRFVGFFTRTPTLAHHEVKPAVLASRLMSAGELSMARVVNDALSAEARETIRAAASEGLSDRDPRRKTILDALNAAPLPPAAVERAGGADSLLLDGEERRIVAADPATLSPAEKTHRHRLLLRALLPGVIAAEESAQAATPLETADVTSWSGLVDRLAAAQMLETTPAEVLWSHLPPSERRTVQRIAIEGMKWFAENGETPSPEEATAGILDALNDMIRGETLHAQIGLEALRLSSLGRELADRVESLTPEERTQLHRLVVEASLPGSIRTFDVKFLGEVPWGSWIGPVLHWFGLAALAYLLFFSLNELVFRQWYEREKLIFPIAELAQTVLGTEADERAGRVVPEIFRNPLFWLGFAIAFGVLFFNGMVAARWIEGVEKIDLLGLMDTKIKGTALAGLRPFFKFEIFFVAIGLAFLLPVEISFSVWFFFLVMKAQQLLAVWLGYGVDGWSFGADWIEGVNFMTAQGGGAMEVFGFIILWKVRHNIAAWIYRLTRPNGTAKYSAEEIKRYTWPSALFFFASVGLMGYMLSGGVGWGMVLLTYFALLFMTIAMVRLVAECGIIGFQAFFGPTHIMKIFGLYRFGGAFAAKGLGTVMMLVSGLFLELKTFIAPTMINAKFLAARNRIPIRYFALAIFLGIGLTLFASSAVAIVMTYDQGVGSMDTWFFQNFPKYSFTLINNMVVKVDQMKQMEAEGWWAVGGGLICAGLIYLRQFLFWVPHPIGLVMFVNPIMRAYWFSFLLAWICKRWAVKYCDIDQYKLVRGVFIGLILGEVVAVGVALLLQFLGYPPMGLGLNKN